MTKRVTVEFADEVYAELARIAAEQNKSLSEVMTDAVTWEKFAADARRRGDKLLVERGDKTFEVVVG